MTCVCCIVAVNRLKSEHNVEIHIPSDADTTAVRIEGSREGVASAKAQLLELVDKMVSSSCSCSSSSSLATLAVSYEVSTQNKALRIMTGQAKTTPVEALRAEAGVCSYKTVSNRLCIRAHEKAARFPADHVGIPSTVYRGPAGVSRQLFFLTPSRQS